MGLPSTQYIFLRNGCSWQFYSFWERMQNCNAKYCTSLSLSLWRLLVNISIWILIENASPPVQVPVVMKISTCPLIVSTLHKCIHNTSFNAMQSLPWMEVPRVFAYRLCSSGRRSVVFHRYRTFPSTIRQLIMTYSTAHLCSPRV